MTGCDGDPSGTNCQQFFIPEGETLSYPGGTTIIAAEGIEMNGTIVIDPSVPGDVTLVATSGDIVLGGKIVVKDSPDSTTTNGRIQQGKSASQPKNGPAADGFTLTLDARGANGSIVLKKRATLFSGRGQHAPDETLASVANYYQGASGGNGGLIILNAPNGKVILPKTSGASSLDELFVLGNGGRGASVTLYAALKLGEEEDIDVVGGLGGNAGELIIDALEIEGSPTLNDMETHPDFIYGGEGGDGGYVLWDRAGLDQEYQLRTITLRGGEGGSGAVLGGNGGFAYFNPAFSATGETFVPVGKAAPDVRCYGGDGGGVHPSPLPLNQAWGGNGGEYVALGVLGSRGGFDQQGKLFSDGGHGGNALGQGGNGGDVREGVRAYLATGGSGGQSDQARTELPGFLGLAGQGYLSLAVGVAAGSGGDGYGVCDGCPGGNGGNAGRATAIGGRGGDVLGESVRSVGGDGGDVWALLRGSPGDGGDGTPGGLAGNSLRVLS